MLTIRDAVPQDIPLILQLAHDGDARGPQTPPLDPGTFTDPRYRAAFDAIAASPHQRLVVGERAGVVVATLQISLIPGLSRFGMWRAMLENVFVDPAQRGTGVGTALMHWAMDYCRQSGCGMIQLTSNKQRKDAHRFYSRLGFAATHEGFKLYFENE